MKYNQPFGISDPNAPYINGNPSTGTMGSIPPAASIEYDQREIVAVIKYAFDNGLIDFNNVPCAAPDNADLTQLLKAIFGMTNLHKLQASKTLYINSSTGDDLTADGSLAKPFRTYQAAINRAQATIDLNHAHTITFHGTGTFVNTGGAGSQIIALGGLFAGQAGAQSIVFDNTAANFVATNGGCVFLGAGSQCTIIGGSYIASSDNVTTNTGLAMQIGAGAYLQHWGGNFGACDVAHFWCYGAVSLGNTGYTISGGAKVHYLVTKSGSIGWWGLGATVSIIGNPHFSIAFASVNGGLGVGPPIVFSGTATGKKFALSGFGLITSNGGGVNYLPGNVAGTINPDTGNGEYA